MSTMSVESLLGAEGAPGVRFASRERRGLFLGLSFAQLMVIGSVVAVLLVTLLVDVNVIWAVLPVAAVVFFFGVGTYRREPMMLIIWQACRYGIRAANGQTRFRRDVWMRVATASLTVGYTRAAEAAPFVASRFLLPGALGDVQIVQIPGSGAFVYNARGNLASITVRVGSRAWALRDKGAQEAAYDGFVEWLSSLENMPGLIEATARIRVDRASTNELRDYLAARQEQFHPEVTPELVQEYWKLTQAASKRSMGFSNTITLTFSTTKLNAVIRDAGKGMAGLATVLKERVAALEAAIEHAGLGLAGWLDANELDTALAAAADPVAASSRRERQSADPAWVQVNPPIMGVDEGWDSLRIDESWHQTFWVAEWPRTDVRTGFLEPLLYAGDSTRVITLQVHPIPIHKALAEVNRAQTDMETAATIRMKLQSRITLEHVREAEALEVRESDLVDGFGDVQFRGFVTVSAESKDALAKARSEIQQASHTARVNLASLSGQQAAGFVTAALPLPMEGN